MTHLRKTIYSLLVLMALPAAALADVSEHNAVLSDGLTIDYKLVTPTNYDAAQAYPAILAFPGGRQSLDRVDTGFKHFWRAEAEKRGFLVISPAAPEGALFFGEGEKAFPEFLDVILARHKVVDGKLHLAGISNGGRSAFHIAARHPDYFTSILTLPGFLPKPTPEKYAAIAGLCVVMVAGENDPRWMAAEKTTAGALREAGSKPIRAISRGDGHLPLKGYGGQNAGRLFDFIESRAGC